MGSVRRLNAVARPSTRCAGGSTRCSWADSESTAATAASAAASMRSPVSSVTSGALQYSSRLARCLKAIARASKRWLLSISSHSASSSCAELGSATGAVMPRLKLSTVAYCITSAAAARSGMDVDGHGLDIRRELGCTQSDGRVGVAMSLFGGVSSHAENSSWCSTRLGGWPGSECFGLVSCAGMSTAQQKC